MSQHIVVIGAVALGPKAAARFKRLEPGSKVTMVDKTDSISYGGCGIPYYVSGDVSEPMQLRTTSFHMVRDETFFKETKDVDVIPLTEAIAVDREAKKVTLRHVKTGEETILDYDKLVMATGASPRHLNLPGEELDGVHYVSNLYDAVQIREAVTKGLVEKAVIVGAGFIGLEMAEAFADMWGIDTTVIEIADQIMPRYVSPALAVMGRHHMEEKGISFQLGQVVKELKGDGRVSRVVTNKGEYDADVVVISAGVIPNSDLAKSCGLAVSDRGGIQVNERMQTSDPDIYSGGDCVEITNQITGKPFYLPMGSMANRQGRVIGTNLAGGNATFTGAIGSFVVKLFEQSLAGAGLSLATAKDLGYDAMSVLLVQLDRAHFYPTKQLMTLELVVDKPSRRILGIQGLGSYGDAMVGRINAVSALLPHKPTTADISNMEMAYSPPFSAAMDILNTLGNMADNALDGRNRGIGPAEFEKLWHERKNGELFFLDCREEPDARPFLERHKNWHNIPQGKIYERLAEIPTDRTIVLVCNTGARSYEAQIMLDHKGVTNVINLHGGMAALKKWGMDI
ncbi:MAG: pyridine nucleotide-disulfide oxidoreductase [Desulfovibrio sp.]|nr:MAG: pyridine nucleotide-disulfide oxidoreductase [Desulfovibrio sp.]